MRKTFPGAIVSGLEGSSILGLRIILFCMVVGFVTPFGAIQATGAEPVGDTLLIFVGEDLDVLSIATRREESAWQAPAVANVITGKQIQERGFVTLAETLSTVPGLYMAQKEWGYMPYMRGIPNSVLFLHDTVPMGSDVTKTLNPLGYELSLTGVKRIEIIRGPGSVLWGTDAFAAIVNIVPLSGKDVDGFETGVFGGFPGDQAGGYVNYGYDSGALNVFAGVSLRTGEWDDEQYNFTRFWQDDTTPVPSAQRYGSGTPDDATYFEAVGSVSIGEGLSLSGRASGYEIPHRLTGDDGRLTWQEVRDVDSGYLKLEGVRELGRNEAVRFLGSYSWLNPDHQIINRTLRQKEETFYGELLYDRGFFGGQGLLTTGVAYREKDISDAPIWDEYLYDYLGPANEFLVPRLTFADYDTSLWAVFGQYTHKVRDFEVLAGVRYDNHSSYEDNLSFNCGIVWSPSRELIFKVLYGTAFRTPFSQQLLTDDTPDLEKITSYTAQVAWQPISRFSLSLVGFHNKIENHIMQDPFAGLTDPNEQETQGIELNIHWVPFGFLELTGNMTLMNNQGPDESYRYNDYNTIDPDTGEVEKHFVDLIYPYDGGADTLANVMATWRFSDKISATLRGYYIASRQLVFPRVGEAAGVSDVWLCDAAVRWRDISNTGVTARLSVKNILDEAYETPGSYHIIEGEPVRVEFSLTKKW